MDVYPYFTPAETFTGRTSEAVTGGRFLAITGPLLGDAAGAIEGGGHPQVGHTAAVRACGVAARDAVSGATVMIYGPGNIVPVEAGAAVTAGQQVEADADGNAIPLAAGVRSGLALSSAADGEMVMCQVG